MASVIHDGSTSLSTSSRTHRTFHSNPSHRGPMPILTDRVHSLLASWAVAFFSPRGINVYAAQNGHRVIPPPLELYSPRRGSSRPDAWSDEEDVFSDLDEDGVEEEEEVRRGDAYLPRMERERRRGERERERRRERRVREMVSGRVTRGDWEVHFVAAVPTLWTPGARPRTYGEPVVSLRQSGN